MTNEETIKSLKKLKSFHNGSYGTAIDEAIKALEQQTCDCISRAKALEMLGEEPENWTDTEKEIQEVNDYRWFKSILEELPPVTPQPKMGEWYIGNPNGNDSFICSVCEATIVPFYDIDEYCYCPNCGSYNGGGEE